jgi:hypothetical protein
MLWYQYIRVVGHPSIWSTAHWSSFSFIADVNHVGEQFKIVFPLHIMRFIISLICSLYSAHKRIVKGKIFPSTGLGGP